MLTLSVLVLILLCTALFFLRTGRAQKNINILSGSEFVLDSVKNAQSLRTFPAQEKVFLFVPHFSDGLIFNFNAHRCEIDGQAFSPGDRLDAKKLSGTHTVRFFDADDTLLESDTVEFVVSGRIPTVFISTASGTYSTQQDKLHKEYCSVEIVDTDGNEEYANAHPFSDRIRGHGNSSWSNYEKKSYNLYLQFPCDLFGMGQSDEWVIVSNAMDLTGMRNKLVYDYAAKLGLEFSPKSEFADVYMDGLYHGTYLLCERVQTGKNRVDIGKNGILFTMEAASRLTGNDNEHITKRGQRLVRVAPEPNNGEWVQRFRRVVDTFEDVIYSDFSLSELENYADIASWAKIGIIEELFSDHDSWTTSQYFYIRPDSDVIYSGPVWDFDYSSANSSGLYTSEKVDLVNLLAYKSDVNYLAEEAPWFYGLMKNAEFYDYVRSVFAQEVSPDFENYVETSVASYLEKMRDSRHMDALRWSLAETEPEKELVSFLFRRLAFFRRLWIECEPYHTVTYYDSGVAAGYFEGEECTADLYGPIWFFDEACTEPAHSFVPERDTTLYTNSDFIFHRQK